MVELLRNIHKEQEEVARQLETEDKQLQFYQSFFKRDSYSTLKSLENVDKFDLAVAILMAENPELDVAYVKKAVNDNKTFFDGLDKTTLMKFSEVLFGLQACGDFDTIRNRFALGKPLELTDVLSREGRIAILLEEILKKYDSTPKQFVSLMDLFDRYNESLENALTTATIINELKEDRENHYKEIERMRREVSEERGVEATISQRQQEKFISRSMSNYWNTEEILRPVKDARKYYEKKEQEQRSRKRYYAKLQEVYNTLEKQIYTAVQNGEEIKNVERLIAKIPDENIRLQALKFIYNHNKAIYDKASTEYQHLTANASSRYQVLLAKYGISPEDYEVGTVMINSIEDLEAMLTQLVSLNITSPKDILRTVKCSNLDTITRYASLCEKGIITSDLLLSHPSLFNPTSKDYKNFMQNFGLIQDKKFNPYLFKESQETLATSHNAFRQGLETLEDYSLEGQMKTGMDYSFLGNQELASAIDTLLELGLEETLVDNIEILNYADRFKRLQLLKSLNMPVSSKEDILMVLTNDKFFIDDSEIDNYIYNAVDHNLPLRIVPLMEPKKKNPDVVKLNDYEATPRTYSFNGVIISKNKTARNLSMIETAGKTSDRLLYGVLKGTVLTDEELSHVKESLSDKKTASSATIKQKINS